MLPSYRKPQATKCGNLYPRFVRKRLWWLLVFLGLVCLKARQMMEPEYGRSQSMSTADILATLDAVDPVVPSPSGLRNENGKDEVNLSARIMEKNWQDLVHVQHLASCEDQWTDHYNAIPKVTLPGLNLTVRMECSWDTIEARNIRRETIPNNSSPKSIDRIYYVNLEKRELRRAIMESWLSKQSIPYQRVAALEGEPDICVAKKQGRRCVGIAGVARSYLYIMDHLNVTGTTLVLEDDFVISDMDKLLMSVQLVPPDWDILRWDCWDLPLPFFPRSSPFSYKVGPKDFKACAKHNISSDECHHCGGLHTAMWRGGESVKKLRKLWGRRPHDDVDCLLQDPSINSYCIQVGIGEFHHPAAEATDIPKVLEMWQQRITKKGPRS